MTKTTTKSKSARISTRIDPNLKYSTEIILGQLGLTPTEAIIMYYQQILLKRGIPFKIELPEKTIEAITNIEEGKNLTHYKSKEAMYDDLGL